MDIIQGHTPTEGGNAMLETIAFIGLGNMARIATDLASSVRLEEAETATVTSSSAAACCSVRFDKSLAQVRGLTGTMRRPCCRIRFHTCFIRN
jgi:hypothetical protein